MRWPWIVLLFVMFWPCVAVGEGTDPAYGAANRVGEAIGVAKDKTRAEAQKPLTPIEVEQRLDEIRDILLLAQIDINSAHQRGETRYADALELDAWLRTADAWLSLGRRIPPDHERRRIGKEIVEDAVADCLAEMSRVMEEVRRRDPRMYAEFLPHQQRVEQRLKEMLTGATP